MPKLDFVEKHGVIRILFWLKVVYNLNHYIIFIHLYKSNRPPFILEKECVFIRDMWWFVWTPNKYWSNKYLVYGIESIFSTTHRNKVKIKLFVTTVIRYAWCIFEYWSFIQAQISSKVEIHNLHVSIGKTHTIKWLTFR